MNIVIVRYILILLTLNTGYSQHLKLHSEHSIQSPSAVSTDEGGNIYFSDNSGNIYKLSKFGNPIANYSPSSILRFNFLESGQSLRVFAYSADQQRYFIFDRFLNLSSESEIRKDENSFIRLSTQSKDNNLWLYDETNYSLIKFNPTIKTIISETPLELILNSKNQEMSNMVEYRNRLYISGPEIGILTFDNLGNYIGELTSEQVGNFDFYKDWVYYLKEDNITLLNIYTGENKSIEIPANNLLYAIYTDELIYLFSRSKLKIYWLTSN